ncbi:ABC transporter permease [Candidatus Woesebacteria bacterium]|nr:ABC transporter permease [Candidatus Woesebacteria bacterium]MCD8507598.1 ABC transporter permease [Candidatus Woesebacteria bacterium]MCD8527441.1 ABC transporter permease [Candidatus Woesebacteria bacterium]MCD8546184.1 ABC transporter permease [Candidatus Woesebacteria bacterium]
MAALTQAFKNIRRSPYQAFAAVLLVIVTFVVGYSLVLFMLGSDRVLRYFETRPQVTAFFEQDIETEILESHAEELRTQSYVSNVEVISQEEALEIYQEQTGNDPVMLELVTADILPPSLEVSTVALEDLAQVADQLEQMEGIDEVVYQEDVVDSLRHWSTLLRQIGLGVTGVFALTAILIIVVITSIRIASRKGEIRIMRLMGATKWYIMQPFLLEGVLYGLLGSVFAWGVVYIGLLYATPTIQQFFGEVHLLPVPPLHMLILLGGGLVVGASIGMIASFFSTRRLFRR